MNREWLTHARAKWAKEMTEARKRYDTAQKYAGLTDISYVQRHLDNVRAQAKALVLIERASR